MTHKLYKIATYIHCGLSVLQKLRNSRIYAGFRKCAYTIENVARLVTYDVTFFPLYDGYDEFSYVKRCTYSISKIVLNPFRE